MTDGDCPSIETLHRSAADDRLDAGIRGHLDRCPRCRAALEEIRRDDDLLADLVRANADVLLGSDTRRGVPEIEGYDLLGEIHRGGQGVVYRAIHNATKRPVAIKTLLQGTFATARQRQRFEREVELAADLRHPHIVTLYDSGRTADGGHFLAMELVEGRPLDQALRHDGLAPPGDERGVRRVLRLVAKIGRAVEAAHLRGVIHRDLKPANILVDESGEPRVLDFGLAKRAETPAAAGATMTGEFLGTCAYAAPEQLAGDPAAVDIRADVYALGVILYESLTGDRPLEATGSMAEVIEAIRHEPPRRPSSRNRAVDDEVETIVLTALAKEPARRYQSAGALVDDIERSLAGAPIAAKRDSRGYLLRKTIQRHRVAVSVAALVVLLTVVFAVAMGVLARQAVTARQRADDATARATGTLTSFLSILGSDQLQRRVGPETIPSLLAKADRIVSEQLRDQPAVAAAVRRELGLVLLARGDFDAALDQFEEALALRRRVRPDDHEAIAESLHNCGRALWYLDRPREAEGRYREALRLRRELLGAEDETVALTTSHLAACLRRQGRYEEAEQGYRAVLALRRRLHGPNAPGVAASLNNLGVCLRDQRRLAEAAALFDEALAMIRGLASGPDDRVAQTLHNLALCHLGRGRLDEADRDLAEALAIKRALFEERHPGVALSRAARARVLLDRGRLDEAEREARSALADQEAELGVAHVQVAGTLELLGRVALATGRTADAADLLRRALDIRLARLPANHWEVGAAQSLLGASLAALGRPDEARPLLEDGHRCLDTTVGPDDPETIAAASRLEDLP